MTAVQDALLGIARCPNVQLVLSGNIPQHPCSPVVRSQNASNLAAFQVPEPWNGRLAHAPILFISSNPSISLQEEYPDGSWSDDRTVDFFTNRFGGGLKPWVSDGNRTLNLDGTRAPATAYWSEIANRASEMLGRPAVAGVDYALSEVVHCKSKSREGVPQATEECVARHLPVVLALSPARILAVVGKDAATATRSYLRIEGDSLVHGPLELAGRHRMLVFMGAPGSAKVRTLDLTIPPEKLSEIRNILAA